MKATDQLGATVWEAAPFAVLAQVRGITGKYLTPATTVSIRRTITPDGEDTPTSDESLTVADCVRASPQKDWPWYQAAPNDQDGYNFRDELSLSTPGTYRLTYAITDTDGGVAVLDLLVAVKDRP